VNFNVQLKCLTHLELMALLMLFSVLGQAADGLPDGTLKQVKNATVYVLVKHANGTSSGSGFLIKTDAKGGYVVTNAHVVHGDDPVPPQVSITLNSGTNSQTVLQATSGTLDAARDLAILRVEQLQLPPPLRASAVIPRETQRIFVAGFPYGAALAVDGANPALSVGTATVTSITNDAKALPEKIQLDGDVNPGNSGGPVVNQQGDLVGVTVAKVLGTKMAFAIPFRFVEQMLQQRAEPGRFSEVENKSGTIKFRVNVPLLEPKGEVTNVILSAAPISAVDPATGKREFNPGAISWPLPAESRLMIDNQVASGELILKGDGRLDVDYIISIRFVGYQKEKRVGWVLKTAKFSNGGAVAITSGSEVATISRKYPIIPLLSDQVVGGRKISVRNAVLTSILIDARSIISPMHWSADGSHVFILHAYGRLRKIAVPSLIEELNVDLGPGCCGLAVSGEGLIVAIRDKALLLLDEQTLLLKKEIPQPQVLQVVSARSLTKAFAIRQPLNAVGPDPGSVFTVDLKLGNATELQAERVGQPQKAHFASARFFGFKGPVVSPDGKFLFLRSNFSIHRFRIDGGGLVYDEVGPALFSAAGAHGKVQIITSADAFYVSLLTPGGNANIFDHPQLGPDTYYIYRAENLQVPVLAVKYRFVGNGGMGFDEARCKLYVMTDNTSFGVFDQRGRLEAEFPFKGCDGTVPQILVHPAGAKMFLHSGGQLQWVELPNL
jgi:S1-C subfamily serine protease